MSDFYQTQLNDVRELTGARRHEVVDASSGDQEVDHISLGRWFEVDEAGIIKVAYVDVTGNERLLVKWVEPGIHHYPNIVRVYQNYTGSTACTAKVYKADGTLVVGVRVVE